jgi:hypothetical protein
MPIKIGSQPFTSLFMVFVGLSISVTVPAFAQYSSGVEGTIIDQTGRLRWFFQSLKAPERWRTL